MHNSYLNISFWNFSKVNNVCCISICLTLEPAPTEEPNEVKMIYIYFSKL